MQLEAKLAQFAQIWQKKLAWFQVLLPIFSLEASVSKIGSGSPHSEREARITSILSYGTLKGLIRILIGEGKLSNVHSLIELPWG